MISSAIDGRIRFRSRQLCDEGTLRAIEHRLGSTTGVSKVSGSARTGSLLVEYLPSVLSEHDVIEAAGLPAEEPAPAPASVSVPRLSKTQKMQVAKRGMLVSMAAILLFAATNREREHIAAGLAFLAFNSYHLYGYRRRLLK